MPVQETAMLRPASATPAVLQHTMASAAAVRSERQSDFLECSTDSSSRRVDDEPAILRQFRLFLIASYLLPICL